MRRFLRSLFFCTKSFKPEIEIRYFGRISEHLLMTSERMALTHSSCTLNQILDKLRVRGDRWAFELDERYVLLCVNGLSARLSDAVQADTVIDLYSRKSIFEP